MKWDFQIYVLALVLFNEMGFSDTCNVLALVLIKEMGFSDTCNVLALVLIKEMGFSDTKCTCTSISVNQ